ncbi:ATP-binding protein [Sphaerotilus sulfidivorans]|uniref:ATP-binding protein n=1 Tax=Sphaerotilus sp. FB-3 TaxID=2913396 RepID=UPI00203BE0A4|nr:AAA family ATPase [Sphaerotilus sp. FB-3]GKQ57667.1 ATPase [Sphaerotilus sp. FB-3]
MTDTAAPAPAPAALSASTVLRRHAEQQYAEELDALARADRRPRPENWRLSPQAVVTYLLGGTLDDGFVVTPKYIGARRLIEIAVATLATDRGLLLYGVPGTAKSWVSEHLAAAVSGDSTLLIQGTAGTGEEQLRYGWNYAELLAHGPSEKALVPSPLMNAMRTGRIARIEELTRIPADVQDTLITVLSEKTLPVPELGVEVQAVRGFSVIATANNRDKGVNELSSALKRRFNTVILPVPASEEEELAIVVKRVTEMGRALDLPAEPPALREVRRVVQIFRELRNGQTEDGKTRLKSPSGTLSTAEAISVVGNGMALAGHFGDGVVGAADLASGLLGAVIKDPVQDAVVWQEYLETVVKERDGWKDLYRACRAHG